MRDEIDIVENVKNEKEKNFINKGLFKTLIAVLIFIVICGLFFNTTYSYTTIQLKKSDAKEALEKRDGASKAYYIEQKLRRDLEIKKNKTDK